ncbi:hypothetical protein AVEN_271203-1 [Araneus ventricosus]|uniref:Uncharacterized protein n=1 Tax=Araneus ventricosus TaxID=182803 RepID=A0A4Y2VLX7_ARAVE|nr:hypothetical protein AVEN_271203-1 [Araneus ventricosus]
MWILFGLYEVFSCLGHAYSDIRDLGPYLTNRTFNMVRLNGLGSGYLRALYTANFQWDCDLWQAGYTNRLSFIFLKPNLNTISTILGSLSCLKQAIAIAINPQNNRRYTVNNDV